MRSHYAQRYAGPCTPRDAVQPAMEAGVSLLAPAKLNLTLEVLRKREDGYHGVRSVMVPIDLCDSLHIARSATMKLRCNVPQLEEDNLVSRALLAIRAEPVEITLEKRIPTGAGLGGGSSDAAAILLAAADDHVACAQRVDFVSTARALGSDVPFFLVRAPALVEGTGERVTSLGNAPPWFAVVVTPPVFINTAAAYAQLDAAGPRQTRERTSSISVELGEALQRGDFPGVVARLHNDFAPVVSQQYPAVATALDALRSVAGHAMLSGSGSSVFALAENEQAARAIAQNVHLDPAHRVSVCAFLRSEAWRS